MTLAEAKRIIDLLVASQRPSVDDVIGSTEKQNRTCTDEELFGRVLEALDEAHRRNTTDAALCREIGQAIETLLKTIEAAALSFETARRDAVIVRCGQIDQDFGTLMTQKLHEQEALNQEVVAWRSLTCRLSVCDATVC